MRGAEAWLGLTAAAEQGAGKGGMDCDEAPLRGPYHDWYEIWRAQQADRRAAEAERRLRNERDDRRIAVLLLLYMVAGGALGALAVGLVMAN